MDVVMAADTTADVARWQQHHAFAGFEPWLDGVARAQAQAPETWQALLRSEVAFVTQRGPLPAGLDPDDVDSDVGERHGVAQRDERAGLLRAEHPSDLRRDDGLALLRRRRQERVARGRRAAQQPAGDGDARGLGLVVSREPLTTPWFESFELIDECAAREDAVLATLKRHALVARSVRVRGRAADADAFTRALSARPDGTAVIFIFREGKRARALVARAR